MMPYIGNAAVRAHISTPPLLGDGPAALSYIRRRCGVARRCGDELQHVPDAAPGVRYVWRNGEALTTSVTSDSLSHRCRG